MNKPDIASAMFVLVALFLILALIVSLTGCNRMMMDTTYSFEYAIIELPNGEVVEGAIEGWLDFENSDQIQVRIDGKTYLVHSEDIALISE